MKAVAIPIALVAALGQVAHADITLSVLSQCNDISATLSFLRNPPTPCTNNAADDIERALADHLRGGATICFLRQPPAPVFTGFRCLVFTTSDERSLVCTRAASYSDVKEYIADFTQRWRIPERQYLDAADSCAVGTGSAAPTRLTPPATAWVAKMEIGFTLALGTGLVGQSTIIHGYGQVDPEVSGEEHAEVEFVEMFVLRKGT